MESYKNFFFTLLLLFISNIQAQSSINWMSLEEAFEAQRKVPKEIIVDVYTSWCGPCKLLDKNTFGNSDVTDFINKHFYAVKFNAEGSEKVIFQGNTFENPGYDPLKKGRNATHQFTQYLGVTGYPTILFFDDKGQYLTPLVGYQKPQQLELYLKLFYNELYKTLPTQEEFNAYFESFEPQFKG
jgi:thioredoxin-related protein